ncbi:DUF2334 domain-containing protein [Desulfonema ishimotonii]|uniref:DUF2334 domain-containing protein n=1 Tax=Desulfonema ishimotonii TaxID=45657 RepID=A0A401G1X4_9BACT|nr:polysaccharide deacetylase family protein [Desulfonema ishimotonii]GBC63207.1 DUF2334 domain-containing protein [Desulfonema ishimotonii]
MKYPVSALWHDCPANIPAKLERCLRDAAERHTGPEPITVFFRADDVGVPGKQYARLMEIFLRNRVPLSLAVVPVWLTSARWEALQEIGREAPSLWCWHQHGWRHVNHETGGKNQEFGPGRDEETIGRDLERGKVRLETLMGKTFYPGFTPPWNRCGEAALRQLARLGFHALSRSRNAKPAPPEGLPDFQVNADLHTRKEMTPAEGWERLFEELARAVAGGCCGVMIHHQRMNETAFGFLDTFLQILTRLRDVRPVHLKDLAEAAHPPSIRKSSSP